MKIKFTVPGEPRGKARPRTVRNKYTGKVTTYTPDKTAEYERLIAFAYKRACGESFGKLPLIVAIYAYYGIPKSWSNAKRTSAVEGTLLPTKKPDADNVVKVVCDALNGVAYDDDSQIVQLYVHKLYSHVPRLEVEITPVGERQQ